MTVLLNFWKIRIFDKRFVKIDCWAPPFRVSDMVSLGWGPLIFISNKFPGGTEEDGPETTFPELMCYENSE